MELPKFETLDLSCDARGVLTVALNRPEKRNAFSGQMIADLFEFAQTVSAMDAVRVVVLRGRGRVFWVKKLPKDFDIFSLSMRSGPLCIHRLANFTPFAASL